MEHDGFGGLKGFFMRIFPVSAAKAERGFRTLEKLTSEVDQMRMDAVQRHQHIQDRQREIDERLDAIAAVQEKSCAAVQLVWEKGDVSLAEQRRQTELLQDCLAVQRQLAKEVNQVRGETHEIASGDIFRRIESIQEKLIFQEKLLQENMLSPEDQKRSLQYRLILHMRALFPVMRVKSEESFIRVGRKYDGGYVMLKDFAERSIAYSFGISDDVSWDHDMAQYGLDVYMYDHTIRELPEWEEHFHFFRIGLGTSADAENPKLRTLDELLEMNGHKEAHGMILKIDIEGAEWAFLQEISESVLRRFSQIVFEFHGLISGENEDKIRSALEKLNRTHQLVHVHANNYGSYLLVGGKIMPELIEATYLLREEYQFTAGAQSFPMEQDDINCPYRADIALGNWDT